MVSPPYLLSGATLIDGTGAAPRAGMSVLVEGRLIAAVGPDGTLDVPADAIRHDLAGRTLMPELCRYRWARSFAAACRVCSSKKVSTFQRWISFCPSPA